MFIVTKPVAFPVPHYVVLCRPNKAGETTRWEIPDRELPEEGEETALLVPKDALRFNTADGAEVCARMHGGFIAEVTA